ncbi:MAG: MerR family transcriptional regulator [Deltaproteobacteria bacterium]|nr:MerR family transcriptional regulator [Deltaproteobacteria bacterium]
MNPEQGTVDREGFTLRMKDLCELTGLDRQVIHFYIQQGLLPEGRKTGRNMAYYCEQHVERVKLIRKLQHERFLPLKAIKALLEERDDAFSIDQQKMLADVKHHLSFLRDVSEHPGEREDVNSVHKDRARETLHVAHALASSQLGRGDFDGLVAAGLIGVSTEDGVEKMASADLWMVELFAQLRAVGFSRELGFVAHDFTMIDEVISTLFRKEALLLAQRLGHLPPPMIAALVESALPILSAALVRAHDTKVRNFFAAM